MLLHVENNDQPYLHKQLWMRVIVAIVCLLSVLGSVLIILSFICFKQLRSRGRQILVHISIMDLGVGLANLTGSLVYFDQYYEPMPPSNCSVSSVFNLPSSQEYVEPTAEWVIWCPHSVLVRDICVAQAFLALYFTLGSIFWSNCLSFYLYFRIVYVNSKLVTRVFQFCCFVSYCFPLLITTWLLCTGRLGFSPYESEGWCSIIMDDPSTNQRNLLVSTFGYNIWILITFIIIPLLTLATYVHVKELKTIAVFRTSDQLTVDVQNLDYKFLLIPVVFIGLRFWSFLGDILKVYAGWTNIPSSFATALILLEGIGDSGQGIVNAIIFVFFTKKVRKELTCPCKCSKQKVLVIQRADDGEQTSLLDESVPDQHFNYMNEKEYTSDEGSLSTE